MRDSEREHPGEVAAGRVAVAPCHDRAVVLEGHKRAEIESRTAEFMAQEGSKPFGWSPAHFVEWATVTEMIHGVGLRPGARVLDVGCGTGWTSLFLAEAGFEPLGVDLVPANIDVARARAERWSSRATFAVADMETLDVDGSFDAALLFDALHHVHRQSETLRAIGRLVEPGGWLLLAEPTWLHRFSPEARRTQRERGWLERGLTVRGLRADLRAAGFGQVRRFFQGTRPYEGWGLVPQLVRLLAARVLVAPQHHIWLAARREA
jgi:2-polyprenyl-3-methyl-5-hydroxy-6-metoxy-1,4-benzoquinol methylase